MDEVWSIRERIEEIDRRILTLLDERMGLVERLADIKARRGLPLHDPEREEELLKSLFSLPLSNLSQGELREFYRLVFTQSVLRQLRKVSGKGHNPFPICASILSMDPEEASRIIKELEGRVEMVELRIDALKGPMGEISASVPLVLTNRRRGEGGFFGGDDGERIRQLEEGIRRLGPEYVDLEWLTPKTLKKRILGRGVKVILSFHDLDGTPDPQQLLELLEEMARDRAEIYKIVTTARDPADSLKVLFFLREAKRRGFRVVAHAMRDHGRLSRLLSPFFGAPFVYASPWKGKEAASGQMTPEELREGWLLLWRWLCA